MAWENICRECELGGLGIKNLNAFNLDLLGEIGLEDKGGEGDSLV